MIKPFIIAAMLAISPIAAAATVLTTEQENLCANIGKLSAAVAMYRDAGRSASQSFASLVNNGLNEKLAFLVVNIAYEQMPYASPEGVAGVTYVACTEAMKQQ